MKTLDEPLCADCHYWRDYSDPEELTQHPDYDGHCWLKGIMTLNVKKCKQHNIDLGDYLFRGKREDEDA